MLRVDRLASKVDGIVYRQHPPNNRVDGESQQKHQHRQQRQTVVGVRLQGQAEAVADGVRLQDQPAVLRLRQLMVGEAHRQRLRLVATAGEHQQLVVDLRQKAGEVHRQHHQLKLTTVGVRHRRHRRLH